MKGQSYNLIILVIIAAALAILLTQTEQTPTTEKTYCPSGPRGDVCITLYKPVCGWFDPAKIQCIKYPCAQTFSNGCFACHNSDILYYTEGECPK